MTWLKKLAIRLLISDLVKKAHSKISEIKKKMIMIIVTSTLLLKNLIK